MKPYHAIPIHDNGEPLVPLPLDQLAVRQPHPYAALGAPYGGQSPYRLRRSVGQALLLAQAHLQEQRPGWRLQIFDAYRPVAVQQFMVDYTLQQQQQAWGWCNPLTAEQRRQLLEQVYRFWAPPSADPSSPPPHSTGAAVDITLVDAQGQPVAMGTAIDELSPRSDPDYFAASKDAQEQQWHCDRTLLNQAMEPAGFRRHPQEWWHFSLGDQLWAWLQRQDTGDPHIIARYGPVTELTTSV
ncbi:D-alanyl-D-alanine dipeptidase [Halomicronema hongdechloris C2206]|uniref:D-alanyl-D-alanine dipeptidase n=1 Tax=Halomicronema hongdechloris C2206 TaxID=1641165 RepID=A0A1Z3HPN3_9CYAN|nr:M15 family metallopeptidase [Halomicronema hongdechloris]ASC72212.1 D-alanyl-D-alanine dipeptidase [Halomicronema hongdechloris C2206]